MTESCEISDDQAEKNPSTRVWRGERGTNVHLKLPNLTQLCGGNVTRSVPFIYLFVYLSIYLFLLSCFSKLRILRYRHTRMRFHLGLSCQSDPRICFAQCSQHKHACHGSKSQDSGEGLTRRAHLLWCTRPVPFMLTPAAAWGVDMTTH